MIRLNPEFNTPKAIAKREKLQKEINQLIQQIRAAKSKP